MTQRSFGRDIHMEGHTSTVAMPAEAVEFHHAGAAQRRKIGTLEPYPAWAK